MKKLFMYADRYLQKSSWKDLALLKFCLFSIGILAGMQIPKRNKKAVSAVASAVFVLTYVPLMGKFIKVVLDGTHGYRASV